MLFFLIYMSVIFSSPNHSWKLVDNKHWQITSSYYEDPTLTDAIENNKGECATGMIQIKGKMKLDPSPNPWGGGTIEALQKTTCRKWISKDFPERCQEFDRSKWIDISKNMSTKDMNFCIDRFESPNIKGQYPIIFIGYYEAESLCTAEGKRLCTEEEWTFACEGEEAMPYPYGYTRDPNKCLIDLPWRLYHGSEMRPRNSERAMLELDRLWQGKQSGAMPLCKSPFGVYDMTGNVDEWTTNSLGYGNHKSILKGGYWSRVRTRCRPSTRNHNPSHIFYQQGFRCCSDI